MSSQERKIILNMLEEKKITLEEAEALLDALKLEEGAQKKQVFGEENAQELKQEVLQEESTDFIKNSAQKIKTELKKFSSTEGKESLEQIGQLFKNLFSGFNLGFPGGGEPFEETISGQFKTTTAEKVDIKLKIANGSIKIEKTTDNKYTLKIKGRLNKLENESTDSVREILNLQQQEQSLEVDVAGKYLQCDLLLYLPQDLTYNLELDSKNGGLNVKDVKTDCVEGKTINGRVNFDNLQGRIIHGQSVNGRVEIINSIAEEIKGKSTNGSVFLQGSAQNLAGKTTNGSITINPHFKGDSELKAETANGRIRINLQSDDCAYQIKAKSKTGAISINYPADLAEISKTEFFGKKSVELTSPDFALKSTKVYLDLKTGTGSILVCAENNT